MQWFSTLPIAVQSRCSNSSPLHIAIGIYAYHGDVLKPTQRRKPLFKLSLQLSDPTLNIISSKLPPLITVTTDSFNPQTPRPPLIWFKTPITRQIYFAWVCVYLFVYFCHKKKCPWDRDHWNHTYTIISSILSMLLKKKHLLGIYWVGK